MFQPGLFQGSFKDLLRIFQGSFRVRLGFFQSSFLEIFFRILSELISILSELFFILSELFSGTCMRSAAESPLGNSWMSLAGTVTRTAAGGVVSDSRREGDQDGEGA